MASYDAGWAQTAGHDPAEGSSLRTKTGPLYMWKIAKPDANHDFAPVWCAGGILF